MDKLLFNKMVKISANKTNSQKTLAIGIGVFDHCDNSIEDDDIERKYFCIGLNLVFVYLTFGVLVYKENEVE